MRVEKKSPEIGQIYFIENRSILQILSGEGSIQIDFRNYKKWEQRLIFLDKGQYIQFHSSHFEVLWISLSDHVSLQEESRVLFKHLLSLGYVLLNERARFQAALSAGENHLINFSARQWFSLNPFQASKTEYKLIFDTKEVIDKHFREPLSIPDLLSVVDTDYKELRELLRHRLRRPVRELIRFKKLGESKRQIAFTDQTIQEISLSLGFKSDAYFNRFFKNSTGQSPGAFRSSFDFNRPDSFIQDFQMLIKRYHVQKRSLNFYADQMNISVPTLSRKVKSKMNISAGQLIRNETVRTAKDLLLSGESIKQVAKHLGFEEANHFTRFFKQYTHLSPRQFREKNVQ